MADASILEYSAVSISILLFFCSEYGGSKFFKTLATHHRSQQSLWTAQRRYQNVT
jgi:hypothetical protein